MQYDLFSYNLRLNIFTWEISSCLLGQNIILKMVTVLNWIYKILSVFRSFLHCQVLKIIKN